MIPCGNRLMLVRNQEPEVWSFFCRDQALCPGLGKSWDEVSLHTQ